MYVYYHKFWRPCPDDLLQFILLLWDPTFSYSVLLRITYLPQSSIPFSDSLSPSEGLQEQLLAHVSQLERADEQAVPNSTPAQAV